MLAREYETWTTDHRRLQHGVSLLVGGEKLRRIVTPARLQCFAQDVLLRYTRQGNRVLEDVNPKVGVELLHLLQRFQEGGDVQVVVVLQPVTEGSHTTLLEDAVTVVVLLQRETVLTLELGIPSHVGRQAREVQIVRTVEPLVREPGLGQGGTISLDPLVIRDSRGQVVNYVQEFELGGGYEHDSAVLLRCENSRVLRHYRDEVLTDELEIVMARVKTQHRHLCEPLHYRFALLLRDAVNVGKTELVYHVRYDRCMTTLKGLVEKMDQLCWVPRDDVLRLRVQGVRNGNRDGAMLALIEEVTGWTLSLTRILVRLEVVDNRVGIRFRLLSGQQVFAQGVGFSCSHFSTTV